MRTEREMQCTEHGGKEMRKRRGYGSERIKKRRKKEGRGSSLVRLGAFAGREGPEPPALAVRGDGRRWSHGSHGSRGNIKGLRIGSASGRGR